MELEDIAYFQYVYFSNICIFRPGGEKGVNGIARKYKIIKYECLGIPLTNGQKNSSNMQKMAKNGQYCNFREKYTNRSLSR